VAEEEVRDGSARLNEEEEALLKEEEAGRASLAELLQHERVRRRNRWIFFGFAALCFLIVLPFIALYLAFVVALAIKLAVSLA
jgi:hypothetical protein